MGTYCCEVPYGAGREAQSIQDAVGTVATYTYDVAERLTKVVYADGSSLNMAYDPNDMLLSVTDGAGKVIETHTYDQNSWGTSSSRANGVDKVVIQYTAEGQAQVVNSKNIVTGYGSATFGGRAYVTSVSGPGCASCGGRNNSTFFYDGNDNRTTSTDALGRATTYSYDANGNVLSSSTQVGNAVINWTYTYDANGNVLSSSTQVGNAVINWTYSYNGFGEVAGGGQVGRRDGLGWRVMHRPIHVPTWYVLYPAPTGHPCRLVEIFSRRV